MLPTAGTANSSDRANGCRGLHSTACRWQEQMSRAHYLAAGPADSQSAYTFPPNRTMVRCFPAHAPHVLVRQFLDHRRYDNDTHFKGPFFQRCNLTCAYVNAYRRVSSALSLCCKNLHAAHSAAPEKERSLETRLSWFLCVKRHALNRTSLLTVTATLHRRCTCRISTWQKGLTDPPGLPAMPFSPSNSLARASSF